MNDDKMNADQTKKWNQTKKRIFFFINKTYHNVLLKLKREKKISLQQDERLILCLFLLNCKGKYKKERKFERSLNFYKTTMTRQKKKRAQHCCGRVENGGGEFERHIQQ